MFTKYAFAVRGARRGKAPVGARMFPAADRPRTGVTAVWQRDPISGRLELQWQSAAAMAVDLMHADRRAA